MRQYNLADWYTFQLGMSYDGADNSNIYLDIRDAQVLSRLRAEIFGGKEERVRKDLYAQIFRSFEIFCDGMGPDGNGQVTYIRSTSYLRRNNLVEPNRFARTPVEIAKEG